MVREKRTKPCSNCKKSKVKCIYSESLPCERCLKSGQSSSCNFAPKLPNLRLPVIGASPMYGIQNDLVLPPFNPISEGTHSIRHTQHILPQPALPVPQQTSSSHQTPHQTPPPSVHPHPHPLRHTATSVPPMETPPTHTPANITDISTNSLDNRWKDQMENTMSNFDTKLSDLVDVLKNNQKILLEQQEQISIQQNNMNYYMNQRPEQIGSEQTRSEQIRPERLERPERPALREESNSSYNDRIPLSRQISTDSSSSSHSSSSESSAKRRKLKSPISEDFRDSVLTQEDARILFDFFDKNITPQLFGFEISKFSVKHVWHTSPILICAICTIASMHHPNYNKIQSQLSQHLHKLCGGLLYKGRPKTEMDGFNTILALIFCSFWLADSQMFTGLALQIAKEIGLDGPQPQDSNLNPKDRLKLWYLLYVLDGQQSLTFNRQPLVNSSEYSLQHSRSLLLANDKVIDTEGPGNKMLTVVDTPKQPESEPEGPEGPEGPEESDSETETFDSKPCFTDLRLVSQVEYNQALTAAFKGNAWELLAPSSLGIPSKSNLELDKWMVSWTVLLSPMNNGAVWSSKSTLIYYNFAKMHINSSAVRGLQMETPTGGAQFPKLHELETVKPEPPDSTSASEKEPEKDWEDSSDDEDDEEFITSNQMISTNQASINASIAFNAAQTVLNLVLNDKDIRSNLKYVPVHVHIMLYYAALLLAEDNSESDQSLESYTKSIANLGSIFALKKIIIENFPVDKHFGERLITSLEELLEESIMSLKEKLYDTSLEKKDRDSLLERLSGLNEESDKLEVYESNNSRGSSPGAIYAWPGSNHGHPSQA